MAFLHCTNVTMPNVDSWAQPDQLGGSKQRHRKALARLLIIVGSDDIGTPKVTQKWFPLDIEMLFWAFSWVYSTYYNNKDGPLDLHLPLPAVWLLFEVDLWRRNENISVTVIGICPWLGCARAYSVQLHLFGQLHPCTRLSTCWHWALNMLTSRKNMSPRDAVYHQKCLWHAILNHATPQALQDISWWVKNHGCRHPVSAAGHPEAAWRWFQGCFPKKHLPWMMLVQNMSIQMLHGWSQRSNPSKASDKVAISAFRT